VVHSYAPRTQRQVAIHQLRRLLQLGLTENAKEFAHRHMLTPDAEQVNEDAIGLETLLALEWAWIFGQKRDLPERIERFKKQASAEQRWRELLQVHLLEMDMHSQGGEHRRAQRSLAQALFVAARRHLEQPLIDRLSQLQRVLLHASTKELGLVQPDEIALLGRLKEIMGDTRPVQSVDVGEGLSEPLTRRERELLDLLEKGLSNQQIADRVHLSVPTVKWHFYKLFAKLQVKNRAAALVRARALNLLR
jgi:LuxR family maltose regulon positive regulatory protein